MTVLPSRRRLLVPEVIQTSAMDCGPAVLQCLLEGFGIPVHYGRLREACQTDVDGTSINVLEEVANQLGLAAEQVMLPANHLLLEEAEALPAILVVQLPSGFTHFVLVWRRHGPFVQVMDPSVGRRWLQGDRLLEEVYVHGERLPAWAWRDWARSDDFRRPLAGRLDRLGLGPCGEALLEKAAIAAGWRSLARLDAVTRLVESLVRAGGLRRGREVRRAFLPLLERAQGEIPGQGPSIPKVYWSALPAPGGPDGEEQVLFRGAVLIRVRGRTPQIRSAHEPAAARPPVTLSPELAAARAEPTSRPLHAVARLLYRESLLLVLLGAGLTLVAGGGVLEALLLRGLIDIGRDLGLRQQRLGAAGFFLFFAGILLLLEYRLAEWLSRLGRRVEGSFRMALLEKIPRLHDRYFQSRPISDMAERGHAIHQIRLLPRLAGQLTRAALALVFTAGAIAWVDPGAAPVALTAAGCALALPLLFHPLLRELDLRVRTHAGALGRFYLDALLGLTAVRAHSAERPVRCEHEGLLVEWARAGRKLLRWVVVVEGLQTVTGFTLAGWLLLEHGGRLSEAGGTLLLAYWALHLPLLGEDIVLLARQYPMHRNRVLRLLEPLGALEEHLAQLEPRSAEGPELLCNGPSPPLPPAQGVAVTFAAVTVRAAGQTILQDIQVHVEAGSHVAIVGASGAGKSSLAGLLLGWHRAAEGQILIDGEPLDAARLERLRRETAWVDPAIQLWNRSLVANLCYGRPDRGPLGVGEVLREADLHPVLQRLPEGLQTALGESGGLLSGGEGQRVRLGRAFLQQPARLVVLDEPFRGLDRVQRRDLLQRARQLWQKATFLCITHDVSATRDFDRVLVLDGGRVVEDGSPDALAALPQSRYRAFLDAETAVRSGLWASAVWQRLWLEAGRLVAGPAKERG
jgi:ABC-type bacteriocin/lantibiotic exporter with double-glycine peptidase domain